LLTVKSTRVFGVCRQLVTILLSEQVSYTKFIELTGSGTCVKYWWRGFGEQRLNVSHEKFRLDEDEVC